jgi:hypothetical protein
VSAKAEKEIMLKKARVINDVLKFFISFNLILFGKYSLIERGEI